MQDHSHAKITRSAGGIVISNEGKVLVVSQNGNSWSLPKGHIEEGEEVLQAAKREILEESGVDQLELLKEYPMYERMRISDDGLSEDRTELKLIFMFLFKTDVLELAPIDPKNPQALWISPSKVTQLLTHPKDQDFYASALPDVLMYIRTKLKIVISSQ